MAIVEEGSGEAPVIADGPYTLTVVSAITGIREGPDKYNPEIVDAPIVHVNVAVGDLVDEDDKPIVLRSTMNLKFSRGGTYQPSTLYLYAVGFGVCPPEGTPFDTDWLKGKQATGIVKTEKEGKWPAVVAESLIPAKKGAQKPSTARQGGAQPVSPGDAQLDAAADAQALESFWEECDKDFLRRVVAETCAVMYPGRTPKDLLVGERADLLVELRRGT